MEVWKDVPNYEGIYKVSNKGRVKSLKRKVRTWYGHRTEYEKIRKLYTTYQGRISICLSKKGKNKTVFVHRLVAETFIPNPHNYPEVNHKDFDVTNNNVENLEWCTSKQNQQHAARNGVHPMGESHGMSKLTKKEVLEIRDKYIPRKYSMYKLADEYGVDPTTINLILKRRKWKHV